MTVTIEKLEKNEVKLNIEVESSVASKLKVTSSLKDKTFLKDISSIIKSNIQNANITTFIIKHKFT